MERAGLALADDGMGGSGARRRRARYVLALTAAYARGDLSQVYPLARGVAPIPVPPAAMLLLGERPTGFGILGVLAVGLGIYVLHLPHFARTAWLAPLRALRAGPARWAMLTGGLTTVYSILDAWNVRQGVPRSSTPGRRSRSPRSSSPRGRGGRQRRASPSGGPRASGSPPSPSS